MCNVIFFITSGRPTIPELRRHRIPERVGSHHRAFGIILLHDDTGAIVSGVAHSHGYNLEDIVVEFLWRWLQTSEDVTWDYLIRVLRACQLSALAAEIEAKITGIYCYSKMRA